MGFMNWSPAMSVGIASFDDQHRKLVDLINQLADAMMQGKGNTVTGEVLRNLAAYTQTHFGNEEGLLTRYDYPELSTHKIEHAKLTQQVLAYQNDSQAGKMRSTSN